MLHDIYSYSAMDTKDHAHKGSIIAKDILELPSMHYYSYPIICK